MPGGKSWIIHLKWIQTINYSLSRISFVPSWPMLLNVSNYQSLIKYLCSAELFNEVPSAWTKCSIKIVVSISGSSVGWRKIILPTKGYRNITCAVVNESGPVFFGEWCRITAHTQGLMLLLSLSLYLNQKNVFNFNVDGNRKTFLQIYSQITLQLAQRQCAVYRMPLGYPKDVYVR